MEKRALGKGLQALLPEKPSKASTGQSAAQAVEDIPLEHIIPNRNQPRKLFSESSLADMAASIKHNGILQPIVVRRMGDGAYELIAGERRVRAAKLAGLSTIPAVVRASNDETSLALALIENIQRHDLNPIEEARAYSQLITEFGLTQEQVAKSVGKERSSVANILRLVSLPHEIQSMLESGALSLGHAKVLCSIKDPGEQLRIAQRILRHHLSVRQTEQLAEQFARKKPPSTRTPAARPYAAQEAQLRKRLGTKTIIQGGPHGGKIIIHFFSEQELERILESFAEGT